MAREKTLSIANHQGKIQIKTTVSQDFPGGAVGKNPSASGGDMDSVPDPGRFLMPQNK